MSFVLARLAIAQTPVTRLHSTPTDRLLLVSIVGYRVSRHLLYGRVEVAIECTRAYNIRICGARHR